jgi:hypothetical protein
MQLTATLRFGMLPLLSLMFSDLHKAEPDDSQILCESFSKPSYLSCNVSWLVLAYFSFLRIGQQTRKDLQFSLKRISLPVLSLTWADHVLPSRILILLKNTWSG